MARLARIASASAILTLAGIVVGFGTGSSPPAAAADKEPTPTERLNKAIDNVTFTDAAGKASSLDDYVGKAATVVVFLSFDCPVSNSYAGTLAELHATYAKKGVGFVAVVPTDDTAAKVAKKAVN